MKRAFTIISIVSTITICIIACKHEPGKVPAATGGNYPDAIGNIMLSKCATAGCHNERSYINAGGLRLDTWEHLFEGANTGAVIVPYSPYFSPLLYFINVDSSLGPIAIPTMPYNHPPLSKEEYMSFHEWVAQGAPNKDGYVAFSSEPATRQKIYALHQSCDMVAVIDAASNLVMRYIEVGKKPYPESGAYITISPDGNYAYLSFWYTDDVYKIDTRTDKVVGTYPLGRPFWNMMAMAEDGERIAVTNGDDNALIIINTTNNTVENLHYEGMTAPYGIAANPNFDIFYVSGLRGNILYKLSAGKTEQISLDGKPLTDKSNGTPDPYEVAVSPDGTKLFVACAGSNELRVLDLSTNAIITTIPVGTYPQRISFASSKGYAFVTCMEDAASGIYKGSAYVIDYNTLQVKTILKSGFYQPNSVAVNEKDNTFYVFSRNQNYDGPAPHHEGPCSGRNGYYEVYDLNTLAPASKKRYEVLVDPIIAATRFK